MPLAGGLMQGYQCGMLWGAALAAGAQAYRLWGTGPQAETAAVIASQRAVEAFRARTGEINCAEIIELNWKTPSKGRILKFFLKGGPIGCFRLAANYAPLAYDAIAAALSDSALSANPIDPPGLPVTARRWWHNRWARPNCTRSWRRDWPAASV